MRRVTVLLLLLLFASCSAKPAGWTVVTSTTAPTPQSTIAGGSPTSEPSTRTSAEVTAHAYNVHLDPAAEQGTDQLRIGVHRSGSSILVSVKGPAVDICRLSSIDATPGPCTHGTTAMLSTDAVAIVAKAALDLDDVSVTFMPTDHAIVYALPNLAPKPGQSACKDNGCNPFFELEPFGAGSFTATATWDGIATGELLMETGAVAAHDYSAHGTPYHLVASLQGSSDQHPGHLSVSGSLPASEAALVLENQGARLLRSPKINVTWP